MLVSVSWLYAECVIQRDSKWNCFYLEVEVPKYEVIDNVDWNVMLTGRKEWIMNWKLFLKEAVVAYLRVVFKRWLDRVRKVMKYFAEPRFKPDAANFEAWVTPVYFQSQICIWGLIFLPQPSYSISQNLVNRYFSLYVGKPKPEKNIHKEYIGKCSVPLSWTRLCIFYLISPSPSCNSKLFSYII
jgi:hypothetical protein